MEPNPNSPLLTDNPDVDCRGQNVSLDQALGLEAETRQTWENKTNDEKIVDQSSTIIRLRDELSQAKQELDKERAKNSELQHNLDEEKCQRLRLEKRIEQFEKFQGAKPQFEGNLNEEGSSIVELDETSPGHEGDLVEGTGIASSYSASARMLTPARLPNYAIQPGLLGQEPPQIIKQNLKRKCEGQVETGIDLEYKRRQESSTAPPTPTQPHPLNSELAELPPLVFQFQSTQIKMGMFVEGKPQILKNASGSESTTLVVGLTHKGNLEYGDGVISTFNSELGQEDQPQTFARVYWVTKHLINCGNSAWSSMLLLYDGERHQITVEFLIGFILKNLKRDVQAKMNGTCSTAVITVPIWYSSSQRIQVKDGVRLAGFTKVFLVNEGSAAVFACPSRDRKLFSPRNILVLSENSKWIDASIYSYTPCTGSGSNRLIMIGHSGHYSQMGAVAGGGDPIMTGDKEEAIIHKVCTEALKNMKDKGLNLVGDTSLSGKLITFSESQKWLPVLSQVGKRFMSPLSTLDMDNEHAVVMCAAYLSQKPEEICEIISDKLAHPILAKCSDNGSNIPIIPKGNVFRGKTVSHTFPPGRRFVKIFQYVGGRPIELFRMTVGRPIPSTEQIMITLTVTNEGIVKFRELAYVNTHHNASTVEKAKIDEFSWQAPNLSLGSLLKAKDLLEGLPVVESESRIVEKTEQTLIEKRGGIVELSE